MIDPKYLQFGKNVAERVHKYSEKLYMAFCELPTHAGDGWVLRLHYKDKILDVGKTGYKRRPYTVSIQNFYV